ncbi:TIGR00730 family Rossman fold protein [Nocardioides panacis]|uniref:LOG family protein n=1 Tax=Nocardioides panacis TaxID=2849501 RepID=UPI0020B17AAE|nr:TIGR00730 family Rossman fold protein [Nocardioides panacis]
MTGLRTVCVFSGSSPGARPSYTDAAAALGREVASRGLRLVYGGASVGLMGTVADAALAAGGEVVGVIPQHLVDREVAHPGLTELRVTTSMHERKAMMATLSDGFVALPGGFGTLEELAEILTWSQLGLQSKPSGLLDVEGFFAPLLAFFDHTVTERFVSERHRALVLSADAPGALLDRLADWRPDPAATKWLDR